MLNNLVYIYTPKWIISLLINNNMGDKVSVQKVRSMKGNKLEVLNGFSMKH